MPEQQPIEHIEDGRLISEIDGWYEVVTKDAEGEAHIHRLKKHSTKVRPKPQDIGEALIRQTPPTRITPNRRRKPSRADKLTLALPDAQIPFEDATAIEASQLAVSELRPDNVVLLGDWLDFPTLSRFEQRPEWAGQVQQSLDTTHNYLSRYRANAPDARIFYLYGNHEERLQKHMIRNNAELLGIKRANAIRELGVMTLEFLLRMKELEVMPVHGYPNGQLWLEEHIVFIHGYRSKQNTSTSSGYLRENPQVSTVHGHSHRAEIQWRTTPTRTGHIQRFAMSAGTLSRIDGSVPSYANTISEQGELVVKAENWQQAIGVVEHNERLAYPYLAHIQDGTLMLPNRQYQIHG